MTNYIFKVYFLLLSLAIAGCSTDDTGIYTGTGQIAVTVSVDQHVTATKASGLCEDAPSPEVMSISLMSSDGMYSHSWPSYNDIPCDEAYAVGTYTLEACYGSLDREGFRAPYYCGSTTFTVQNGKTVPVDVECRLANVMLSLSCSESFQARYPDYSAILHSIGHGYVNYPRNEIRPVYLHPGDIDLTISLTTESGAVTKFHPTTLKNALPGHHYHILFDIQSDYDGTPLLVLDVDDELVSDDVVFRLDDTLLNSPMPSVSTEGFIADVQYIQDEGTVASSPLRFVIDAPGGIQSIVLTSSAPSLTSKGWPQEVDIVSSGNGDHAIIAGLGLKYEMSADGKSAWVDFTDVLPHITHVSDVEESIFTIVVLDRLKKVNDPSRLRIVSRPVPVDIDNITGTLICETDAELIVTCVNPAIVGNLKVQLFDGENWSLPADVRCLPIDILTGKYRLIFPVGTGGRDIAFRLLYNETVKADGIIYRKSPAYSINVDAFAKGAVIKIDTEESYRRYLTDNLTVYVNNVSTPILWRNAEKGMVAIGSLLSGQDYYITSSAMADNESPTLSNTVPVETEITIPLTNGDFEEAKSVIENYPMASGGRYSASIAPIFNQQNTCNVNVSLPSEGKWATVNAKTFCTYASNRNTWYMQPSAVITNDCQSGSKAIKLTSVGWDIAGEPIEDYVQESTPYTSYSRSIPHISHFAAGRLFMGNYKFDPLSCTEIYDEGVDFTSRPSALNGYFKYIPGESSPQDRGLAKVELIGVDGGREIVIAESVFRFHATTDYTAFSIPIEYGCFGVKATKLRVLFASTDQIGSIEEESIWIKPHYNAQSAAAVGSSLYIDNVSLSY